MGAVRVLVVPLLATVLAGGCPRVDSTLCGEAACQRDQWNVVAVGNDINGRARLISNGHFETLDIDAGDPVVTAAADRATGRLAVVTAAGKLLVAPGVSAPVFAAAPVDLPVIGAAWSNAGSRLASTERNVDGSHVLRIYDAEFVEQLVVPVRFDDIGPPPTAQPWRLAMSWSADDRWIAVSHDASRGATFPSAQLVRTDGSDVISTPAFEAFFIGATTFVARRNVSSEATPFPRTEVFVIEAESVERIDSLDSVRRVRGSDPVTGVVITDEVPRSTAFYSESAVGLRTLQAGPDIVEGIFYLEESYTPMLLPRAE